MAVGGTNDAVTNGTRQRGLFARVQAVHLGLLALALLAGVAVAVTVTAIQGLEDATPSGAIDAAQATSSGSVLPGGIASSDLSGLPDASQTFVHGTSATTWNSSGSVVPDAWLVHFGFDPLNPSIARQPAALPETTWLPAAYGGHWPAAYTPSLADIYAYDRPVEWNETTDGVHWNGLDPRRWDANNDSIPDGWLMHHGLDPLLSNTTTFRPAGPEGLTVLQAFTHQTNPFFVDTDGDGLSDADEIRGPLNAETNQRFNATNPARYSTLGTGICDGYLAQHGLDPTDASVAHADLAASGASTLERFSWSHARFGARACSDAAGLDPRRASTIGGLIPDGWFMRHGLDPLDAAVASTVSGSAGAGQEGPWMARTLPPSGHDSLADLDITVVDEYHFGRPVDWMESRDGPWWGGTSPATDDTDGDGLPDATEMRGFFVGVSLDIGPASSEDNRVWYLVRTDPTRPDTSGDGLTDFIEVVDEATDPTKRDTDLDGIPDVVETRLELPLDATRADSAGDYLLDGTRLDMLLSRSQRYLADISYEFPGPGGATRKLTDWVCDSLRGAAAALGSPADGQSASQCALSNQALADLFGPAGDADGDGLVNAVDPDMDGDGLSNGWEANPALYEFAPAGLGPLPRPTTDMLNPDTDGDGLSDAWEVEHGRPDFALVPPRYSMDPSRWDSDDNGISDADEDPDEDGIEWPRYAGDGQVTLVPYIHSNRMEYQFGTDPNVGATDQDGLLDGWKVFWGVQYKDLMTPSDRGAVYPGAPGPFNIANPEHIPRTGRDQSDHVVATGRLIRFDQTNNPGEGEELAAPRFDLDEQTPIYRIERQTTMTFVDVQENRLNPYMAQWGTSGDGIPDWWKLAWARPPVAAPPAAKCMDLAEGQSMDPLDPLVAASNLLAEQPDGYRDQLSVEANFRIGTNPWCYSTTTTGFPDSLLAQFTDPLDLATNIDQLVDQDRDTDGDGLKDFEEILAGLNPAHPDSDGDGLLDGGSIQMQTSTEGDAAWIRFFLDLGVAVSRDGERHTFFGEIDFGTDSRNGDDAQSGVPAGWLVAHDLSPRPGAASLVGHYAFARPSWWQESEHGPWWGGLPPGEDLASWQADPDRDRDGLRDTDGEQAWEDPFPGANDVNQLRALNWSAYPSRIHQDLPAPADQASLEMRLQAQGHLNPRAVDRQGIHFPDRAGRQPPQDRTPTCMHVTGVTDAKGGHADFVTKGIAALVTGRVHDCSAQRVGIPNVTVEARFGSPVRQVFGAAYTLADGSFHLPINISGRQRVNLETWPGEPVLKGHVAGVVEWRTDPARIAPGEGQFGEIRAYSTVESAASSQTIRINVRADAQLTLDAPKDAVAGPAGVTVEYLLADSAGTPLQDPLSFHWSDGVTIAHSQPGADGRGVAVIPTPADALGAVTLVAVSHPAQPDFVSAGHASAEMTLRSPVDIRLLDVPERIDAGDDLLLRGRVELDGVGVPEVPVAVRFALSALDGPTVPVVTDADGMFRASVPIAMQRPQGVYVVVATADQTSTTIARETSESILVRSRPSLTAGVVTRLVEGDNATITARLQEPDGQPIAGGRVAIELGALSTVLDTEPDGTVEWAVRIDLPPGPATLRVSYGGGPIHASTSHVTHVAVAAGTQIVVPNLEVARGATARVSIDLLSRSGSPVVNAPVNVQWRDEEPLVVLTDSQGHVLWHLDTSEHSDLGQFPLRAWYDGSDDGSLLPAMTSSHVTVVAQAGFVLPAGPWHASGLAVDALLIDIGTGLPLPGRAVELTVGRVPLHDGDPAAASATGPSQTTVVATHHDGAVELLPERPLATPPFAMNWALAYSGDDTYAGAKAWLNATLQASGRLQLDIPPMLWAGNEYLGFVTATDDRGDMVPDGTLFIYWQDRLLGRAPVDGTTPVWFTAPPDAAPGPLSLVARLTNSTWFQDAAASASTTLVQRVDIAVAVKPAAAGGTASGTVVVTSNGSPIPFVEVVVGTQTDPSGTTVTTNGRGEAAFFFAQPAGEAEVFARYHGSDFLYPASGVVTTAPVVPTAGWSPTVRIWLAAASTLAMASLGVATYLYAARRNPLEPIVRSARKALWADESARAGILAVFRSLEDAAIGLGLLNEPVRTARELEAALGPQLPPSARLPLAGLIDLFEVARYGDAVMLVQHRDAAERELARLQSTLRRDALGVSGDPGPRAGGPT